MPKKKTFSLSQGSDTIREIKKHSSLVQMGNITTVLGRKLMNCLICIAKDQLKRSPAQRLFTCDIGIIKRLAGIKDSDNQPLKEELRNFSTTQFEYNIFNKDSNERWIFSFLAEVKILTKGRGKSTTVSFEFPTTILEVIKNPNMYVVLDMLVLKGLKSKHAIALYEFAKDYQKIGEYTCSIEGFRKLMGVKPSQYKVFTMLKKRVLDVAVEEINDKTDVSIDYELENEGRRISAIRLQFTPKELYPLKEQTSTHSLTARLQKFGLKTNKIETLMDAHTEQFLHANIEAVEEQIKKWTVKNPTAYLLKAFQNDYRPIETEYSKQQREAEERKQLEAFEAEKQAEEIATRKKEFKERKKNLVQSRLEQLDQNRVDELKQQFIASFYEVENTFFAKLYEVKGFDDPVIQNKWAKFLVPVLLSEDESDFETFQKHQYAPVKV